MQHLHEVIALACFAWLFTVGADPIQWIKEDIGWDKYIVLNCPKCFAFWLSLGYTAFNYPIIQSLGIAVCASAMAALIDKILGDTRI